MFFSRMMLILSSVQDQEAVAFTVRRAMERATRPELLRFVIPEKHRDAFQNQGDLFAFDSGTLENVTQYLRGETHFLLLGGRFDFARGWDQQLQSALQHLSVKKALLTGCMQKPVALPAQSTKRKSGKTKETDIQAEKTQLFRPVRPDEADMGEGVGQAHLPALRETEETERFRIEAGLPLVCAAKPVRTLLIDPAFIFGPTAFLQEADWQEGSLSLSAYLKGYQVYVPIFASLWPTGKLPVRNLQLPPNLLPGTTVARFGQMLGIGQGSLNPKSMLGLFGVPSLYPQALPNRLRMCQRLRSRNGMPLLVSAFIDLPDAHRPAPFYLLRFGFLQKIACLPLLLYTGGAQERALRGAWPNTQSYPDRAVREQLSMIHDAKQAFRRSKVMLMRRAAQRQMSFTHVAWVDMDVLPHPICPEAVPVFKPLMDGHIHMAVVDGTPDTSFLMVPVSMLKRLEKDVLSITQLDGELKRGFSEEALWIRLYQKHPQDFVIHHMPARQLLFASVFDRELLSADLNRLLAGRSVEKQEAGK